MTEIAFHFNAENRLAYVCRLLRKAVTGGAKLVVIGSTDELTQLDDALWTFSATDFVPHCGPTADPSVREKSPIYLANRLDSTFPKAILVNLGESIPVGFEHFQRLIEVVTFDELDRKLARMRWKNYADLGCTLVRHDLRKALL